LYKLTNGSETVLYDFLGGTDGDEPNGSLVFDKTGNLYGTTYNGGSVGGIATNGTIFKVSPTGTETVLHRFAASKQDGEFPNAGLVMDKHGNFYGTTIDGGVNGDYGPGLPCTRECGVVYQLTAAGSEKVLYAFKGSKEGDGAAPLDSLILDSKGNLYGTTYAGGTYGQGTVFELTPAGQEIVLYSFSGTPDGGFPAGHLVMDSQGNLYGTTSYGGTYGQGTVFELTTGGVEKKLYSFTGGADGGSPLAGLVIDSQGNLYGTTFLGGNFNSICQVGCGVVFKVTP
ncbi:MAG: choice-of-anchor tandem repeat GloVer-containing protein, partial [Terriglobales bacterium]